MPVNPKLYPASKRAVPSLFPSFSSNSEAKEHLARYPAVWEKVPGRTAGGTTWVLPRGTWVKNHLRPCIPESISS